ncbi:MAG: ATP-dependent Clp protease proteolytic subunit, partial [Minisyncoccia bacterium]
MSTENTQTDQLIIADTNTIKELDNKTILFYEDIDEISALHVNRLLLTLDKKLYKKYLKTQDKLKKYNGTIEVPSINLRIHSQGGDVFSALSIIDIMSQLNCNVNTYVDGCAASGAAMIAIHGKKRFIGKNSFMLLHQLRGSQSGKFEDMQDEIKNSEKIMKLIREMVKNTSKIDSKEI